MSLSLDDFITHQAETLLDFASTWRDNNATNPVVFPLEVKHPMYWVRQYLNFVSKKIETYYESREKDLVERQKAVEEGEQKLLAALDAATVPTTVVAA